MVVLFRLLVLVLLPALPSAFEREFVQHIQYTSASTDWETTCRHACQDSTRCQAFTAQRDGADVGNDGAPGLDSGVGAAEGPSLIDCFLYDDRIKTFLEGLPEGMLHHGNMRNETVNDIDVRRQLLRPLVTDGNVFTNTEQHFVRGCSYTVAIWTWLYKPRILPDHELNVFTTREVEMPRKFPLYVDEALLPSIVLNVGGVQERSSKYFFAATLDDFGSYHGFWPNAEVRWHEWVHLALVVTEDTLSAYINGEHQGTVYMMAPRRGSQDTYCPYNSAPRAPHTSVPQYANRYAAQGAGSNTPPQSVNIDKSLPLSFAPFPPANAINNTVLQIAGKNSGQLPSTAGMFFDLVIVRNAALSAEQIALVKDRNQPHTSPTLRRLLRAHGKYSLEGFCALEIYGFALGWRQRTWGLCPEAACGPVSVGEEFRLGPPKPVRAPSLVIIRRSRAASGIFGVAESQEKKDQVLQAKPDTKTKTGPSAHARFRSRPPPQAPERGSPNDAYQEDASMDGYEDDQYLDDLEADEAAYEAYLAELEAEYLGYADDQYYNDVGYGEDESATQGNDKVRTSRGGGRSAISRRGDLGTPRPAEGFPNTSGRMFANEQWLDLFPKPLRLGKEPRSLVHSRLRRLVPQVLLVREENELAAAGALSRGHGRWAKLANNLTDTFGPSSLWNLTAGGTLYQFPDRAHEWCVQAVRLLQVVPRELWLLAGELFTSIRGFGLSKSNNDTTTQSASYPTLDTATELYHAAMLLLHDRHEGMGHFANESLLFWKRRTSEQATSFLSLALWFANEDVGVSVGGFSLRSAPPLSQPIQLALGFAAGFDVADDVKLPADLGVYLEASLGGSNLYKLLGLQHSSNVDAIELLSKLLGSGPRLMPNEAEVDQTGATKQSQFTMTAAFESRKNWLLEIARDQRGLFSPSGELRSELHPLVAALLNETLTVSSLTRTLYQQSAYNKSLPFGFSPGPRVRAIAALEAMRQLAASTLHYQTHDLPQRQSQLGRPGRVSSALMRALNVRDQKQTFHGDVASTTRLANPQHPVATPQVEEDGQNECFRAVAHYFPVSQFVTAHFGITDTGVALQEDVRLSTGEYLGQAGEDDELQLHNEAEAEAGNAEAQMWLGRRYFWGYGGLMPNAPQALRWFERAAAQGDAEGLYNVGVFHNNGQGGLPVNPDRAMDYFLRAANAANPFPMALHAVGQHYLRSDPTSGHGRQNLTLARDYFLRAAELNSADGHFSLAMMYRDGTAGRVDVPLCVVHLAMATQLGHVRAANFLAHGLVDPESWLGLYGREVESEARLAHAGLLEPLGERLVRASAAGDVWQVRALLGEAEGVATIGFVSAAGAGSTALTAAVQGGFSEVVKLLLEAGADPNQRDGQGRFALDEARLRGHEGVLALLQTATAQGTKGSSEGARGAGAAETASKSRALPITVWSHNASLPIMLHLPAGSFALPVPLGRGNGCPAALQLLKNIAENSFRPNDLTKAALASYLAGDVWAALDAYDEAATLGVQGAMENAAWLYGELGHSGEACGDAGHVGLVGIKIAASAFYFLDGIGRRLPDLFQAPLLTLANALKGFAQLGDDASGPLPVGGGDSCRYYLDKMTARRNTQLANTGDHLARRDVADMYARSKPRAGSTSSAWAIQPNHTHAALLYALAAEQGDVHSAVHLAWLLSGLHPSPGQSDGQVVPPNVTAARAMFRAATDMELKDSASDGHGGMAMNTMGVASQLGLLALDGAAVLQWLSARENEVLCAMFTILFLLFVARARNIRVRDALSAELRERQRDRGEQ